MIKLELANAVTEAALKRYEENVARIAEKMEKLESPGFEYLGWKDLPAAHSSAELARINEIATRLAAEHVDLLVVIGIGGSFAGAKAAIEFVQGEYTADRRMEVMWVGESLSSTNLAQKLRYAEKRNFAINVISKSGTTTEPAIAFRLFRKLLEDKVGVLKAANFIIATTDAHRGALLKIARDKHYETFAIPDNIGGRFSVLTPVGLFPMACAGLDIGAIMRGAERGQKKYSGSDLQHNDAYRYAVARTILGQKFPVELMVQYEPRLRAFNEWWKQLAGESEGKNETGLFPASAIFTTDLHSLGQFIQDGSRVLFETVMTVVSPKYDVIIVEDKKDLDGLNYLVSKTVNEINAAAFTATTEAHVRVGKVPNIHIAYSNFNEATFGELTYFFMRAVAMTGYLAGINPFNQPGVEVYKQNLFKILGKVE